jgi:hypothetical protein
MMVSRCLLVLLLVVFKSVVTCCLFVSCSFRSKSTAARSCWAVSIEWVGGEEGGEASRSCSARQKVPEGFLCEVWRCLGCGDLRVWRECGRMSLRPLTTRALPLNAVCSRRRRGRFRFKSPFRRRRASGSSSWKSYSGPMAFEMDPCHWLQ